MTARTRRPHGNRPTILRRQFGHLDCGSAGPSYVQERDTDARKRRHVGHKPAIVALTQAGHIVLRNIAPRHKVVAAANKRDEFRPADRTPDVDCGIILSNHAGLRRND